MKGMGRSLCYWGYTIEKSFLTMTVSLLAILLLLSLMEGKPAYELMPSYIVMMGLVFVLIQFMNNANYHVPLTLSYGSTRMESVTGMELAVHVMAAQCILLLVIVEQFIPDTFLLSMKGWYWVYTAFFLVCCCGGNLICAASLRFGNKAGILVYVVLLLVGVAVITGIIITARDSIGNIFSALCSWYSAAAALLADMAAGAACCFAIKKYEVRNEI